MSLQWSYIVVKGTITVEGDANKKKRENYSLRTMLHLNHAYLKSITHL